MKTKCIVEPHLSGHSAVVEARNEISNDATSVLVT